MVLCHVSFNRRNVAEILPKWRKTFIQQPNHKNFKVIWVSYCNYSRLYHLPTFLSQCFFNVKTVMVLEKLSQNDTEHTNPIVNKEIYMKSGLETNFSACQSNWTDRLQFLSVRRKIIQSTT
jgi:hypothetical protein